MKYLVTEFNWLKNGLSKTIVREGKREIFWVFSFPSLLAHFFRWRRRFLTVQWHCEGQNRDQLISGMLMSQNAVYH